MFLQLLVCHIFIAVLLHWCRFVSIQWHEFAAGPWCITQCSNRAFRVSAAKLSENHNNVSQ